MDLNTILGKLSFKQLLTKYREVYKKIKIENAMAEKASGMEKVLHLEKRANFIRIAEAIIKRINTLAVQDTMAAAQGFSNQIRVSNISDQKQIDQINDMFNRLLRVLESVDRHNLIEYRKAGDLVRFNKGMIDQVKSIKYDAVLVATRRKAAYDNVQQYRKAA